MRFSQFKFHPDINAGIDACGYTTPTPIQAQTIPPILGGKDVLGLAQTGTGKTAAFVLPILQRLTGQTSSKTRRLPRSLIMAPTRELAEQIHENIKLMAVHTPVKSVAVYGGVGKNPQINAFRKGVDIIVACPGRLLDLMNENALTLNSVEVLVLDEADQMLDMGFLPDIRRIIKYLPKHRQSLVFSATMPKEIRHLAQNILNRPVTVRINRTQPAPRIAHARFNVQKQERTALLKKLFAGEGMTSTLVFTRTKHKAKSLAVQLKKAGFRAVSLQGNLSQNQRRKAMEGFRSGSFNILVATDIAARGIDVSGVSHVINYDLPDTVETYIHRTGRTGRADQSGQAYTFASVEDGKMVALIEKAMGKKMMEKSFPQN
ncbi:MAG: DEAD/DEAH box helicase [Desulfobacter sp.]|nr:MAG: DEAD/DEAH box helicase [Desulfobacter sp.]